MKSAYLFDEFCKICEQQAEVDGRKGAANNYRKIRQKLEVYTSGSPIHIADINEAFVQAFNEWLIAQNHEKATISFYNRTLRSVYNQAVKKKMVKDNHPFGSVYTNSPVVHYPIRLDNEDGDRLPFETISRDDLLKRYKALAYKYNTILRQLKGIVQA